jgi:N-acetylglucosamine-6-phosphate deacetylase
MTSNILIQNGTLITPDKTLPSSDILIEKGKIVKIGPGIGNEHREDFLKIDARGMHVLPGLVDIHTHGGNGSDIMDATTEDFKTISWFQASHGITTFIPSTVSIPFEHIISFLESISPVIGTDLGGAVMAGVHIEGPFLSLEHRGAHPEQYIISPEPYHIDKLKEFKDIIKTITIAPEIGGALEAIKEFADWGVLVSGGHDMATDKIIAEAIENGMHHTTHIFCVMSGLRKIDNHRTLGLNEHTLLDDRLTTEMIADNRHIPPLLAKLIFKCKGSKKLCLISDCSRAAGMPIDSRRYALGPRQEQKGSHEIIVGDGVAMTPDGTRFAGSIITIEKMIRNCVEDAGIDVIDAVRMASLTPAEIHGIDKQKGSLEIGKDGDVCIINSDYEVYKTITAGKVIYSCR